MPVEESEAAATEKQGCCLVALKLCELYRGAGNFCPIPLTSSFNDSLLLTMIDVLYLPDSSKDISQEP